MLGVKTTRASSTQCGNWGVINLYSVPGWHVNDDDDDDDEDEDEDDDDDYDDDDDDDDDDGDDDDGGGGGMMKNVMIFKVAAMVMLGCRDDGENIDKVDYDGSEGGIGDFLDGDSSGRGQDDDNGDDDDGRVPPLNLN
ncbi:hypothetical protein ElyMa_006186300 [Elysia marginata]|uniref:Uncharacterized protein n=1 Tax=Elysia marginata TaxID=1093978 RepID=A0AAV4H2G9_9GAST|nr:hypothetical protein ElyMa_006186300 [Elysia marginata]